MLFDILVLTELGAVVLLSLVLFISLRYVGEFPSSMTNSDKPRKELIEVAFVYITSFLLNVMCWLNLSPEFSLSKNVQLSLHVIVLLILPAAIEFGLNKQSLNDLGLIDHSENWMRPALFAIGVAFLWGFITFFSGFPISKLPLDVMLFNLFSPAFIEEWEFRGFYQTKLERVYGTKAWRYSGLLFGMMHIPTDFFGSVWRMGGGNVLFSLSVLMFQTVLGWIWGVTFIKTRNIWVLVITHYLFDFLPSILLIFI